MTEKRPRGRQSLYKQEVADSIIEQLSAGTPLADICRQDGMPAVRTVSLWRKTYVSFDADFVRAREEGWDAIAADCLRIANTPLEGVEITEKASGSETKRADMLGHRKLQIETRLKLLAKWDPRRYGEKLQLAGADDLPPMKTEMDLSGVSTEALAQIMRAKDAAKSD